VPTARSWKVTLVAMQPPSKCGHTLWLVIRFTLTMFFIRNTLAIISDYWLSLTASLLLLVTALSLWPLPSLPEVPGSDKTHHLIAYAVLVFPVVLCSPKRWLFIVAAIVLYGGVIELIQPFVNRYGEWLDFFANTAGVMIGVVAAGVVRAKVLR
jgi:VanZ family protein